MNDFLVIGAGPTGSYCAARLAKLGYSVQLVDKAHFPRDKLCGGGLTLKSISRIKALHTGFEQAGIVDYVQDFHIGSTHTPQTIPFKWIPNWLGLVKRDEFDTWMLNKAIECGARYSIQFRRYLENKSFMMPEYESRFVISADGVNSEIGKMIHGPFPNNEVVIATEAYVPNNTGEAFASVILNPTNDPDNGGYSWLFGRKDRIGIGTGVVRNYDSHMNGEAGYRAMITAIAQYRYSITVNPKLYHNWVIPIFKNGRSAVYKNMVCIGDALGVADPIYAEGIAAGMISADCLIYSFQKYGNFSHFENDLYSHEYFSQMKWMSFLQQQANSNYQLAFKLLQQKGVVEGFLQFINWQQTPYQFIKWVWKHYPSYALKLQYNVWKNRGKEN